jgi:hypothetical protein
VKLPFELLLLPACANTPRSCNPAQSTLRSGILASSETTLEPQQQEHRASCSCTHLGVRPVQNKSQQPINCRDTHSSTVRWLGTT